MRTIVLLGGTAIAVVMLWGTPESAQRSPNARKAAAPSVPAQAPAGVAAAPGMDAPADTVPGPRDVTPRGFTPSPDIDGPLERIGLPPPPVAAPEPDSNRLLKLVAVEDATSLRAGQIRVRLAGIAGPDNEARCRAQPGAEERPCAALATAALRALVGRRAVTCLLPKEAKEGEFRTACRLGRTDLSEWLARQGWAIPVADATAPVTAAAAQARTRRAGMWSAEER